MKPAKFEYHAPQSVDEVVSLLSEHGDDAKVLAGGQSLVPMLNMRLARFEHLVDLNRVAELQGIDRSNGGLAIRSMTRQAHAERAPEVEAIPLLAQAVPFIAHFQIRNRGTIGGSLVHADPAAELPAVALALDAEFEIVGAGGARRVPAREFYTGTLTTILGDDELLAAIHFPLWDGRCGFAVEEVARRSGDFALAGIACALEVDAGGGVRRAAISFFGMAPTPVRAGRAEAALVGTNPSTADLPAIAELAVADCEPGADVHASAEYRNYVGARLAEQAVARALGDARRV